jgi:L-lactate dehydrogenase complex protein LldE
MRVSLFVTCLADLFYPNVAESLVRILHRLGIGVDFPKAQTCCGQPALNSGFIDEARSVAARMIDIFEDAEIVVTPSGSCCSIVREYYPTFWDEDTEMARRARALADKTYEFVEFLEKVLKVDWKPWNLTYPAVATYHYSCHLRGIGMTDEVIQLMGKIDGLEYRPLEKMEQCCGFGGTFSVKCPDISGAMVRDKVECVKATGASLLVCTDAGCVMNIAGAARRMGVDIELKHIITILDEAMANGQAGREAAG